MVDNLQPVTMSCIKLTHWGELFLSAFPIEAVSWADSHFGRSTIKSADPFKKVVKLCLEWCNQQGVKPSWAPMYQQQRLQGQPVDTPMYVLNSPKGEEQGSSERSATSPLLRTTLVLADDEVLIAGTRYRVLSVTELEARQAAFLNNQQAVAGIDKLALLIGKRSAADYFKRVFDNLKFEEIVKVAQ